MAGEEFQPALDVIEEAKIAILNWSSPDEELGWPGAPEVADHAEELAGHLWESGVLKKP
jgi:hypothetical protein